MGYFTGYDGSRVMTALKGHYNAVATINISVTQTVQKQSTKRLQLVNRYISSKCIHRLLSQCIVVLYLIVTAQRQTYCIRDDSYWDFTFTLS